MVSDGFLPPVVTGVLYKKWFVSGLVELNGWSFVHAMSGCASAAWMMKTCPGSSRQRMRRNLLVTHILWEWIQFAVERERATPRWAVDAVIDTIFYMAGAEVVLRCTK